MPHPQHPPTPASSTEIRGKDGSQFSSLMSFELPPPAAEARPSNGSSGKSSSSYRPTSPTSPAIGEAVKIRRRSSTAQAPSKDAFALPPPPTRSRKIIQMKPRGQPEEIPEEVAETSSTPKAAGTKKKQPSSTSVAGRKIARKTAHSLIERRRRSKMNEEFGVLKDMIPACNGEMHKLAILQASIDYVRYLEGCVAKLKAENTRSNAASTTDQFALPPPATRRQYQPQSHNDEDIEMDGSDQASAADSTLKRPSVSPALLPQDSRPRHDSYSSVSTDHRHYSFSTTTSPALGPGVCDYSHGFGSALTSPALLPQSDQDATVALLMLNADRRGTHGNTSSRGMSVKDLLSA